MEEFATRGEAYIILKILYQKKERAGLYRASTTPARLRRPVGMFSAVVGELLVLWVVSNAAMACRRRPSLGSLHVPADERSRRCFDLFAQLIKVVGNLNQRTSSKEEQDVAKDLRR